MSGLHVHGALEIAAALVLGYLALLVAVAVITFVLRLLGLVITALLAPFRLVVRLVGGKTVAQAASDFATGFWSGVRSGMASSRTDHREMDDWTAQRRNDAIVNELRSIREGGHGLGPFEPYHRRPAPYDDWVR